jgi:hypothetical protein
MGFAVEIFGALAGDPAQTSGHGLVRCVAPGRENLRDIDELAALFVGQFGKAHNRSLSLSY